MNRKEIIGPLSGKEGFTLIELMVVVAILSIVAAIAVPNYLRYQAKSRQAEAKTNLSGIFVAETTFFGELSQFGSFSETGFTVAASSNRYSYRSPANGGNAGCGATGASPTACYIPAGVGTGGHAADNAIVPSAASNVAGSVGFTATAVGDLDNDATLDEWHVNDIKEDVAFPDTSDM